MFFDSAVQILTSGVISALVTMWINYGIEHHRRQQDALSAAYKAAVAELDAVQQISSDYWMAGKSADDALVMKVTSAASNLNSAISVFEDQIDSDLFFELSDAVTGGTFAEPQTEPNEGQCLRVITACGRVRTLFHKKQIQLVKEKYWLFRFLEKVQEFFFPSA